MRRCGARLASGLNVLRGYGSTSVKQRNHFLNSPRVICNTSFHCRSDTQRLMHAAEVVVHEVERDRVPEIFDFL